MYRINEIRLKPHQSIEMIPDLVRKKTGCRELVMKNIRIARRSIDARNKRDIRIVYTVDFDANTTLDLAYAPNLDYISKTPGRLPDDRPVIAGFGPCGMFCALILAEAGLRPIVLERGKEVGERVKDVSSFNNGGRLDTESNVQFGEGGAGTFSDGKLTTGIKDPRIRKVLTELNKAGAPDEIMYEHRPHIGTDVLPVVVRNVRKKIESLGGEIRFTSKLTDIEVNGDLSVRSIEAINVNDETRIKTNDLVFAMGHSAYDTLEMMRERGIQMIPKPFSIGVRIEHPQKMINTAQYGSDEIADVLGPAEYKLAHHNEDGRGVYTFCMCPGGSVIVSSSDKEGIVTNGMSNSKRDGAYANSGLLVDVRTEDFAEHVDSDGVFAGFAFRRRYEEIAYEISGSYTPPSCRFDDFLDSSVHKCLPGFASKAIVLAMPHLARKLNGFDAGDAMLYAPETRSSSPVSIPRDDHLMCNIRGVYPAGEGAGHAGGITSAAVDGIRVAESIIERYSDSPSEERPGHRVGHG